MNIINTNPSIDLTIQQLRKDVLPYQTIDETRNNFDYKSLFNTKYVYFGISISILFLLIIIQPKFVLDTSVDGDINTINIQKVIISTLLISVICYILLFCYQYKTIINN